MRPFHYVPGWCDGPRNGQRTSLSHDTSCSISVEKCFEAWISGDSDRPGFQVDAKETWAICESFLCSVTTDMCLLLRLGRTLTALSCKTLGIFWMRREQERIMEDYQTLSLQWEKRISGGLLRLSSWEKSFCKKWEQLKGEYDLLLHRSEVDAENYDQGVARRTSTRVDHMKRSSNVKYTGARAVLIARMKCTGLALDLRMGLLDLFCCGTLAVDFCWSEVNAYYRWVTATFGKRKLRYCSYILVVDGTKESAFW